MESRARQEKGRTGMTAETTKWFVKPVESAGKTFYQVRRNVPSPDNPKVKLTEKRGGYYRSKEDAKRLARTLNDERRRK